MPVSKHSDKAVPVPRFDAEPEKQIRLTAVEKDSRLTAVKT